MKVVLQRCLSASVTVDSKLVSSIGKGILVLAGIGPDDTSKDVEAMAAKVVKMKLWEDEEGRTWRKSVADIDGEILCVSQFTLYARTDKGLKPDFHGAAGPEHARTLYELFFTKVQQAFKPDQVKNGVFQAMMQVALVNDGPVTIQIENGTVKKPSSSSLQEQTKDTR